MKKKLNNTLLEKMKSSNFFIFIFLGEIYSEIQKFKITDISSQIAFYFTLSFFPFLFLLASSVPLLPIDFTPFLNFIKTNIPDYLKPVLINDFKYYLNHINLSTLSIGFVLLLYSSSSATNLIIRNLNIIFNVNLMRGTIFQRIWSIFLNFIFIILIFIFILFTISVDDITTLLNTYFNINLFFLSEIIQFLIVPLFFFIIILIVYHFSVPKRMKFKDIYIGALFVSIVLIIAFFTFNIYLSNFGHFGSYGVLGTFIILMLYFYIISFVILLGAIINKAIINFKNK